MFSSGLLPCTGMFCIVLITTLRLYEISSIRGYALATSWCTFGGIGESTHTYIFDFKRNVDKNFGGKFFRGDFTWDVLFPVQKYLLTFHRTTRSYTVKENHIGSAVSSVLWYRQTDTVGSDPVIFLVFLNEVNLPFLRTYYCSFAAPWRNFTFYFGLTSGMFFFIIKLFLFINLLTEFEHVGLSKNIKYTTIKFF